MPRCLPLWTTTLLVLPGQVGQGGNVSVKPHTIALHLLAFSQTPGSTLSRAFLWGLQHRSYPFMFVPGVPWALCLWNPHPQRLKPDFLGRSSEAQVKVSQSLGPPHSLMFWTPRGPHTAYCYAFLTISCFAWVSVMSLQTPGRQDCGFNFLSMVSCVSRTSLDPRKDGIIGPSEPSSRIALYLSP